MGRLSLELFRWPSANAGCSARQGPSPEQPRLGPARCLRPLVGRDESEAARHQCPRRGPRRPRDDMGCQSGSECTSKAHVRPAVSTLPEGPAEVTAGAMCPHKGLPGTQPVHSPLRAMAA